MNDFELKQQIVEIGKRMYLRNFVAANDGNISAMCEDGTILATPSGVSKGFLREDMLVKLDLDGNILDGKYAVTSEIKMHLRIYKENPSVKAVTHAHPPVSTCFAICHKSLKPTYLTEAIITLGEIPCAPYATPGTNELPNSIAPYVNEYKGVLLANHGVVTWGKDLMEAFYTMESIEYCANIDRLLPDVGTPVLLSKQQIQHVVDIVKQRKREGK